MKHIQGSFLTGFVTVLVKGANPELFFQKCVRHGIEVWNMQKESQHACYGNIKLQHVPLLKSLKRGTNYKLKFVKKRGFPFYVKQFFKNKHIIIGLILSALFIFWLSNIVWKVEITGVPKELEEQISERLHHYGIHRGAWALSIDSPGIIQKKLINDIPELLWIGVHKKGTTFILEGVEKIVVEEEEVDGPRNLVATKKGVISKMHVSKGKPQVAVDEYVEPGDVLVSGKLDLSDDADDKKEPTLIAAEGDIRARTWYETSVTVPLEVNYEVLTGERKRKYFIQIGAVKVPVWGFGKPDYDAFHRESDTSALHFLKWKLPIKFDVTTLSEKEYRKVERTKDEAIDHGLEQARRELRLQLGPDAEIISEKILHDVTENGKVKLILHMNVEEDIVKKEPINQGD